MAISKTPEDTDSRTSSVGRKRGSQQNSQNSSTANSSTSEVSGRRRRSDRKKQRAREQKQETRKRHRDEDPEENDPKYLERQKKQKLQSEDEAQDAKKAAELRVKDSATNSVSWNKGVQPILRTSFGKKLAVALKPAPQERNAEGGAPAVQPEDRTVDNQENDEPPACVTKGGEVNADKKEKRGAKKGTRKAQAKAHLGSDDLPKPTQKLNVGRDGEDIWVKYSLEHNPRSKRDEKKDRTKHWVNKEIQNRFVPRLLIYNADILDKLDEEKIKEVISAFIAHQNLYDDEARTEAYKATDRQEFLNYCKNQLKKAKNVVIQERQNQGNPPLTSENPFGKLVASTDVSNAVSDIDENEFEEQGGEDMDISMVESNESGEISDDGSDASDFPNWKTRTAGDRSGRSPSFEPHPVDSAIESRLSNSTNNTTDANTNTNMESKPEVEVIDMTVDTPEKQIKNLPPIPGYPQQLSIALAEVEKYYPDIGARDQPYCLACSSAGHIAAFCPELTCATCHVRGEHFTYACPQNIICSKCREAGHRAEDCQEKLARSVTDGVVCEICGSTKHIGDNCHLLWRTYYPEKIMVRKVQSMLVDCYSCGRLNHFGTECGLRGSTRMPYAGQSWTAENRARYLEGSAAGAKTSNGRNGIGFAIRGMGRNEPIQISDSEEETFIRPKVAPRAPPPQKQHLKFADRVTMPNQPPPPPPRNNNLPMYAQQPPPPQQNWGAVQGNGAYRAENFAMRNGMDYADDYGQGQDYQSLNGRDHDDFDRHNPRHVEPFRPQHQNTAMSRDPFSTRPPPKEGKRVRQPRSNGSSGGGRGRSGGVGARGGRGGGGGGGVRGGRGGRR